MPSAADPAVTGPITGGCLCGGVRYRLARVPHEVFLCHCRQCQKAQGSAFVAAVPIARADFELLSGAELLKSYRASPAKSRVFCGECGAPLYSQVDGRDVLRLRAGSLDDATPLTVTAHIHVATQAPWFATQRDAPQYPGFEPGRT